MGRFWWSFSISCLLNSYLTFEFFLCIAVLSFFKWKALFTQEKWHGNEALKFFIPISGYGSSVEIDFPNSIYFELLFLIYVAFNQKDFCFFSFDGYSKHPCGPMRAWVSGIKSGLNMMMNLWRTTNSSYCLMSMVPSNTHEMFAWVKSLSIARKFFYTFIFKFLWEKKQWNMIRFKSVCNT